MRKSYECTTFFPLDFRVRGSRSDWEPQWGLPQLSLPTSWTRPDSPGCSRPEARGWPLPVCQDTHLSYYPLTSPQRFLLLASETPGKNLENNSGREWTKEKMYCTPYRDALCTLKSNLRTSGPFPSSLGGKKTFPLDFSYFFWQLH